MFALKSVASALAFSVFASAAPTTENKLAPPIVTLCSGSINPRAGCADIPVPSDTCVNLVGGLTFLNDEISNGQVPVGFACTFFANFGCVSVSETDTVFLQGGTYRFSNVPGLSGPVNFNDKASSFTCSPIF